MWSSPQAIINTQSVVKGATKCYVWSHPQTTLGMVWCILGRLSLYFCYAISSCGCATRMLSAGLTDPGICTYIERPWDVYWNELLCSLIGINSFAGLVFASKHKIPNCSHKVGSGDENECSTCRKWRSTLHAMHCFVK